MRVMEDVINEHGLADDLEDCLVHETGNTCFWLGLDDGPGGLDEASDHEDPEAEAKRYADALQQESADRQGFLDAVQGALDSRGVLTDLERARMQLEDLRSVGRA